MNKKLILIGLLAIALILSGCVSETGEQNGTATGNGGSGENGAGSGQAEEGIKFRIDLDDAVEVNGKLAYVVEEDSEDDKEFVVYDGKEQKKYDWIQKLAKIDGKLVYYGDNYAEKGYWVYDGEEKAGSGFTEIGGKLAYRVQPEYSVPEKENYIMYGEEKVGLEYYRVGSPYEVNGKLTYVAKKGKENEYTSRTYAGYPFVVYDGEEQPEYKDIWDYPFEVNGKLTYIAGVLVGVGGVEKEVVVYDGKEQTLEGGGSTREISCVGGVNGKLAYRLKTYPENPRPYELEKRSTRYVIVYDGERQPLYDYVKCPYEVNGKLIYWATNEDKEFIVYGGEEQKKYDEVENFLGVNGKLAYVAKEGRQQFVVYDGKEHEKYYQLIDQDRKAPYFPDSYNLYLTEINGRLVYSAIKKIEDADTTYNYDLEEKIFIVYGEEEVGTEYQDASSPIEVNGKLAYVAKEEDKQFVVYDGKELKKYDLLGGILGGGCSLKFDMCLLEVNGKLAYVAREGDKQFVVYDGKELKKYDDVERLIEVNGKLAYIAKEGNKQFVVFDEKELKKFDS
ncbi:MAG: hypothetical protein QGI60_03475 [archaeon]|nr:hypothetical protein [archaeon]